MTLNSLTRREIILLHYGVVAKTPGDRDEAKRVIDRVLASCGLPPVSQDEWSGIVTQVELHRTSVALSVYTAMKKAGCIFTEKLSSES